MAAMRTMFIVQEVEVHEWLLSLIAALLTLVEHIASTLMQRLTGFHTGFFAGGGGNNYWPLKIGVSGGPPRNFFWE